MKAVRLTRNLVVVIALVVSLGANVTLFVGGVLYSFVDRFVEEAFDLATAAGKQRKALTALKTSSAKQTRALAASRTANDRLRGQLQKVRSAAGSAAKESRKRLVKAVGRSIVTAPVKVLPYAGAAAIVGFTAWEISVFCKTIRDMDKIQKAAGAAEAEAEIAPAVCEGPEPAVKRAVVTMKNFSRDQWDEIRKHAPDLPGWDDIPDSWLQGGRSAVPDILRAPGEVLKRLFPALDDQAGAGQ